MKSPQSFAPAGVVLALALAMSDVGAAAAASVAACFADPVEPVWNEGSTATRVKSPAPHMRFTAGLPIRILADVSDSNAWMCPPGHPPYVCPGTQVRFFVDGQLVGTALPSATDMNLWELRLPRGLSQGDHVLTVDYVPYKPGSNTGGTPIRGRVPVTIHVDAAAQHGGTITLTSDIVLTGSTDLNWTDKTVIGNGFKVSAAADYKGRVTIRNSFVKGLGNFGVSGVNVSTTGAITVADSIFEATGAMRFNAKANSAVTIKGNEFRANNLITYVANNPDVPVVLEVGGPTSGAKVVQGNRIGAGILLIKGGSGWQVGGSGAGEGNILMGPRAVLEVNNSPNSKIQGNYLHHDYHGGFSQGFNLWMQESSTDALAEHNVIRGGSWPIQSFGGEFRYNLVLDSGHAFWRSARNNTRIHHNLFAHTTGVGTGYDGAIQVFNGESGLSIYNNTFDLGGAVGGFNGPVFNIGARSVFQSIRNNLVVSSKDVLPTYGAAFVSASDGTIATARVISADYNAWYNPLASKTVRYRAGMTQSAPGIHDIQADPKLAGTPEIPFRISEGCVWSGAATTADVLAHYRQMYRPAAGSPLINSGSQQDGAGTAIGAVGPDDSNPADLFGRPPSGAGQPPVPPSPCAARSVSWAVAGNSCSASTAATDSGSFWIATDAVAPNTGSATFQCTNGTWGAPTAAVCNAAAPPPPPSACAAQLVSWAVAGNSCSASTVASNSGSLSMATDSVAPNTGSATFRCTNGNWGAPTAAICNAAPPPPPPSACAAQLVSWTVAGNSCSASTVASSSGSSTIAADSVAPNTGSATFQCTNGTWGAPTAAVCNAAPPVPPGQAILNPIMFVTQVPAFGDFGGRASTFANHQTSVGAVPRGGDLMIRYVDGTVRNLTKEAGFGVDGVQGAGSIAVREPSIHWSGTKAVFSMLVGGPTERTSRAVFFWQLYEVSGFGPGQQVSITKVPNQPTTYNNVSPIYGTDDRILFTTDRPRSGMAHLYPNLDEYESAPAVSGIWSLNPSSGSLHLLNHTPSGAFSPSIDSFGRLVFIRWDHLQRDQARDAGDKGAFNYTDESATATSTGVDTEVFPEPRITVTNTPYGPLNGNRNNMFVPWAMNEDGTEEETLNHVGRHELTPGYLQRTFLNDPSLSDLTDDRLHDNQKVVTTDGGLFHLREDPARPGEYLAIMAREFGSLTTNQIVKLTGAPNIVADKMVVTDVTVGGLNNNGSPGGRFRNPLPLVTGALVATYTTANDATPSKMSDFRLKLLAKDAATGLYNGGAQAPLLTAGIVKSVSWFNPNNFNAPGSFSGPLWEMEAVEVVARTRPVKAPSVLEAPERNVFVQQGVDQAAFRSWLTTNNLALIVTRNVTTRDNADIQQPFNLQVPGGVKTVSPTRVGPVYNISNLQIFQADQIRAYANFTGGRRNIAQPLHGPGVPNLPNPGGPAGSVKIASDGSAAAFVPARRALSWQTTDPQGVAVVRERLWITMQPGEVRVCASCHGVNSKDQAGRPSPTNEPQALRELLSAWKAMPK